MSDSGQALLALLGTGGARQGITGASADIIIDADTDAGAWNRAMDDLVLLLEVATSDASVAAAKDIQARTRELLLARGHAPGTKSPSPPGSPPARVSGSLAASIQVERSGPYSAMVGPTAGYGRSEFYARIQELGGEMHGHAYMWFKLEGRWRSAKYIELPPRPYLAPATDELIASGDIEAQYIFHWTQAIEGI